MYAAVLKYNPNHDHKNGQFSSGEKAAHRLSLNEGYAKVLNATNLSTAVPNTVKAKAYGVSDVALASNWIKNGHHMDALAGVGIKLTDKEKKSFQHWKDNPVAAKAKLKSFADKEYPKVYAEYAAALKEHGPDHPTTKKLAKKNTEWVGQAHLYGASDKEVADMIDHAKKLHEGGASAPEPAKAKPAAPKANTFVAHEGKTASLGMNKALGEHYYQTRKDKGVDHADTKAAYVEWEKSKKHLMDKHGYSKNDIGKLSSEAKSAVENKKTPEQIAAQEKQKEAQAEAAKKAQVLAEQKAKVAAQEAAYQAEQDKKSGSLPYVAYGELGPKTSSLLKSSEANFKTLTAAERKAVKQYTGPMSGSMNYQSGTKKGDWSSLDEQTQIRLKSMDKAMAKARVSENTKLFRAVTLSRMGGAFAKVNSASTKEELEKLVGHTYTEDSYASTSTSLQTAKAFLKGGRAVVEMDLMKGDPGLWVGGSSERGAHPNENEMILPRGLKYIVTGVTSRTDIYGTVVHAVKVKMIKE
jgi:hypothetical protein